MLSKLRVSAVFLLILAVILVLGSIPVHWSAVHLPVTAGTAFWPESASPDTLFHLSGTWKVRLDDAVSPVLQKVPGIGFSYGTAVYEMELFMRHQAQVQLLTINIGTSGNLAVNGNIVGSSGVFGAVAEEAEPTARSLFASFSLNQGWNTIRFEVSNFVHPRAGLWERIYIGEGKGLLTRYELQRSIDLILIGGSVGLIFFLLLLYLLRRDYMYNLFFSLALLFVALGNSARGTFPIYSLLPDIGYECLKKSQFGFYFLAAASFLMMFQYEEYRVDRSRLIDYAAGLIAIMSIPIYLLPYSISYYFGSVFSLLLIPANLLVIARRLAIIHRSLPRKQLIWQFLRLTADCIVLYGIANVIITSALGSYGFLVLPYAAYCFVIIHTILFALTFRDSQIRLEAAGRSIIDAGEKERNVMLHDLHDRLGQLTHGLGFMAESLKKGGGCQDQLVDNILTLSSELNRELRSMIGELSRGWNDNLHLSQAIESMAARLEELYGIPVKLDLTFDDAMIPELHRRELFFIVSEALSNAAKHAVPSFVSVTAATVNGRITIRIMNDGVIPSRVKASREGNGLAIMAYRTETLGGKLSVGIVSGSRFLVETDCPICSCCESGRIRG